MKTSVMTRLLCTTVYVFSNDGQYVLMLDHRKLGKWLPPGGKVDPNEIPDDAAVRETLEETGMKVRLLGNRSPVEGGLMCPWGAQLNVITPGKKEHIDLIYLAQPLEGQKLVHNERESNDIAWFPVAQILEDDFDTFDSVKKWVAIFQKQV